MIEKRFTLQYISEQHSSVNLYDNGTFIGSICLGEELILEVLNSLAEENEELKQKVGFYKDFQKDARELDKENEQLKQEIAQLHRWNKCLAEKRHQEMQHKYHFYENTSERSIKDVLRQKTLNCFDRDKRD